MGREDAGLLNVHVGLMKRYVTSPWRFNFYENGVVKEVNGKVKEEVLL